MKMKTGNIKNSIKISILCLLAAAFTAGVLPADNSAYAAYAPPYTTLKVGLYYESGSALSSSYAALPSANLMNAIGYGSGFSFGCFDSNRQFILFGSTTETAITMMRD
jgi:hypothetical protein